MTDEITSKIIEEIAKRFDGAYSIAAESMSQYVQTKIVDSWRWLIIVGIAIILCTVLSIIALRIGRKATCYNDEDFFFTASVFLAGIAGIFIAVFIFTAFDTYNWITFPQGMLIHEILRR
ncbi:MAG: hypothetical protein ACFNX8_00880 [Lancefieldella rimae]